ncbi:MAG: virulence RhuM family protein [Alphaproteobacteria bacterium]|nr:virulence RhuM family protein [Alphaproteobacteria bacterium]
MNTTNQFIIYQFDDNDIKIDVKFDEDKETIWMSQKELSILFNTDRSTISKHISNIFNSGELLENSTCAKFAQVEKTGFFPISQKIIYYNLDVVVAVGYRVNSKEATRFRIWATKILREYMVKGFVLDDERLKNNSQVFGKDYLKELLERVRSIRASERRIWQQITDIFQECSIDYDISSKITKNFFATVQNKFHFAIHGRTASELIYNSVDHKKDNINLTTWKNSPDGRILKSDVKSGKNYLLPSQIKKLEKTVIMFFDYIELIIENDNTFTMESFANSVNKFLSFNEYEILVGNGNITREKAIEKAQREYDVFNKTQKINSDFDKSIAKITKK